MRHRELRLVIAAGSAAWWLAIACGAASAQRSRVHEFGPDAVELQPRRVAVKESWPLAGSIEPAAGNWRPWVLASGRELRLPPPPDDRATAAEQRELRRLAAGDDAAALERIRFWDFRSPGHRWNEMLVDIGIRDEIGSDAAVRAFALLNVAIYDAMVAAWDSKYAYNRNRPGELDGRLAPEVTVPRSPSYPCEHSVAAGAAAAVLAHLFPADAPRLTAAADAAAWSRVAAGAVYPSDVRAGLDLGRAVAARVIAHAGADDARWASLAFLKGADRHRAQDETRWALSAVRWIHRQRPGLPWSPGIDASGEEAAKNGSSERTPVTPGEFGVGPTAWPSRLNEEIGRRLAETGLDGNAPRAARAYALAHLARCDAAVAFREANAPKRVGRSGTGLESR